MYRPPFLSDRQWSHISLAWHLTWPGWLAGMSLFAFGGLTNREAIFAICAMVAIGRALRLWAISPERLKLIPSGTVALLRLAARVTLMECIAFSGVWYGWSLLHSPEFDPDAMLLQCILIPWATLFFIFSSLESKESHATDL